MGSFVGKEVGTGVGFGVGDKIACLDASENVGGADVSALIGLARPFVRELVSVFVALDTDVGRAARAFFIEGAQLSLEEQMNRMEQAMNMIQSVHMARSHVP